jgi:hypothetical protein
MPWIISASPLNQVAYAPPLPQIMPTVECPKASGIAPDPSNQYCWIAAACVA